MTTIEAGGVGVSLRGKPWGIYLALDDALTAGRETVDLLGAEGQMVTVRLRDEFGCAVFWRVRGVEDG